MELIAGLVIFGCLAALVLGRTLRRRSLSVAAGAVLIYVAGLVAWWFALYFRVVPVFDWLAQLGVYRPDGIVSALVFFGPPVILAAAILLKPATRRK